MTCSEAVLQLLSLKAVSEGCVGVEQTHSPGELNPDKNTQTEELWCVFAQYVSWRDVSLGDRKGALCASMHISHFHSREEEQLFL